MKDSKVPLRKCIGCGEKKEKKEFVMVVRPPKSQKDAQLFLSPGGNKSGGRSAYICTNNECLKKVKKARRLERTFRTRISNQIYEKLEKVINNE